MDATPTADIVYQGICALYYNSNSKEKEKANKWLEDFQKSIYSWSIADELLQQKRDLNSCYFAAQTMRNKIQFSFNELPLSSHDSLRISLIAHISQITSETDPVIVTQLSLAVADLVLLMASWNEPVADLLDMLSSQTQLMWPLLEILTVIPEEIDSRYLRLGQNRRAEVHKQLDAAAPKVLEFLCYCVQHSNAGQERIMNSILRCFSSWISIQAIPIKHFTNTTVGQQVFSFLNRSETSNKLHDSSTECICSALSSIEYDEKSCSETATVEYELFNCVCALEQAYHTSVALEDIDKTMNYCRIFTVLCESFLGHMLSNEVVMHYSHKGLDLVLMCVGHFDYDVAEITFNLWYRLSDELFQRNSDTLTRHFKPSIERLLSALYRHAQMEADHEGLIEESDGFSDFRRKVSELIRDVAFIMGSNECFKQMFNTLLLPNASWESTESALFVMQNVAKNIVPDERAIIPKVVEAILNLPENTHIAVRYTSIMLLGELCDWIENHPESLEAVLNYLLYALQQKNGLATAAATSLTSICAACQSKMTCHIPGLIEIARNLHNYEINNELAIGLLKSISLTLGRIEINQLSSAMREIITFQLQPLVQLLEDNSDAGSIINKNERTDPAYWIDRACAIIRHTQPKINSEEIHPTLQILTDIWPLLSRVMDKYQRDVRIMERTCRLIRYGIRTVHKQGAPLVEPLIKQMITLYGIHHHSCFLYLGSVLVDEFAKSEECVPALLEMLKAFIEPTFNLLQVENGLKNNPDTVDDFFRLCSRFMDSCPINFVQSPLVAPIFQCALLACTLDHREANSSVMKFFYNLFKWGRVEHNSFPDCRPFVVEIAHQNGEALMTNLIHATVFDLHSYMFCDVAEVINELKDVAGPERMQLFLKSALDALPKKNSGGFVTATQHQLNEFSSAIVRADSNKAVTAALKTFARLYR